MKALFDMLDAMPRDHFLAGCALVLLAIAVADRLVERRRTS